MLPFGPTTPAGACTVFGKEKRGEKRKAEESKGKEKRGEE